MRGSIDFGGTFTELVLFDVDSGVISTHTTLSAPEDPARAGTRARNEWSLNYIGDRDCGGEGGAAPDDRGSIYCEGSRVDHTFPGEIGRPPERVDETLAIRKALAHHRASSAQAEGDVKETAKGELMSFGCNGACTVNEWGSSGF